MFEQAQAKAEFSSDGRGETRSRFRNIHQLQMKLTAWTGDRLEHHVVIILGCTHPRGDKQELVEVPVKSRDIKAFLKELS